MRVSCFLNCHSAPLQSIFYILLHCACGMSDLTHIHPHQAPEEQSPSTAPKVRYGFNDTPGKQHLPNPLPPGYRPMLAALLDKKGHMCRTCISALSTQSQHWTSSLRVATSLLVRPSSDMKSSSPPAIHPSAELRDPEKWEQQTVTGPCCHPVPVAHPSFATQTHTHTHTQTHGQRDKQGTAKGGLSVLDLARCKAEQK